MTGVGGGRLECVKGFFSGLPRLCRAHPSPLVFACFKVAFSPFFFLIACSEGSFHWRRLRRFEACLCFGARFGWACGVRDCPTCGLARLSAECRAASASAAFKGSLLRCPIRGTGGDERQQLTSNHTHTHAHAHSQFASPRLSPSSPTASRRSGRAVCNKLIADSNRVSLFSLLTGATKAEHAARITPRGTCRCVFTGPCTLPHPRCGRLLADRRTSPFGCVAFLSRVLYSFFFVSCIIVEEGDVKRHTLRSRARRCGTKMTNVYVD